MLMPQSRRKLPSGGLDYEWDAVHVAHTFRVGFVLKPRTPSAKKEAFLEVLASLHGRYGSMDPGGDRREHEHGQSPRIARTVS